MSVKRRSNGRWQARWRDAAGRPRSKDFTRKIDAENHERTVRADADRGVHVVTPKAGSVTVKDWAATWIAGARDLGKGGRDTYERDLENYIVPALGDIPLRRLTHELIDEFLEAELAEGLAGSTVNRHYRTINRLCTVAVARKRITVNPCSEVTPPPAGTTAMRILSAVEIERLADAVGARYRAWLYVATYGGLRWSEMVGLRRARIDGARLTVAEQLIRRRDGKWHRDKPKSKAGVRTITVPPFLVDVLADHLDQWAQQDADGLVFPNRAGNPMRSSNFTQMVFKPACVKVGLGRLLVDPERPASRCYEDTPRIHDLRHTAVALSIAAGAHPKAIQTRMGHASIKTTLDLYGHLFPEIDEQIAVDLERIRATTRAAVVVPPST